MVEVEALLASRTIPRHICLPRDIIYSQDRQLVLLGSVLF